MKKTIKTLVMLILCAIIAMTAIPATEAQAAVSKPVIKSSQIMIKNNACSIQVGKKAKLVAKSGSKNVTKNSVWKSSNNKVATVSKSGLLVAKKAGTAYVTAKYKGKASSRLKVVVKSKASFNPVIQSNQVTINNNTCSVASGKQVKLIAKYNNSNITNKCVWKSSDTKVATISKSGLLATKKTGTTYVTAKYNGKTSSKLEIVVYKAGAGAYAVTFSANGGKFSDGSSTKNRTYSGEIMSLPDDPNKAGSKFLGWFTSSTGGNRVTEMDNFGADTTVYAHYTDKDRLWIELNLGCDYGNTYGFATSDPKTSFYHWFEEGTGGSYNVGKLPTPSVPGATFIAWCTDAALENELSNNSTTSATTLYAKFSRKLKINFESYGGGTFPSIEVETYKQIRDCGIDALPEPSKEGSTFEGWALQREYFDAAKWVNLSTVFENQIEYTDYICNACPDGDRFTTRDYLQLLEHQAATNHGSKTWKCVMESPTEITLHALYSNVSVNITFDPQGGVTGSTPYVRVFDADIVIEGVTYRAGFGYASCESNWPYTTMLGTPPEAFRDGYKFMGWFTEPDGGGVEFNPQENLTKEDLTLYAKWELDYRTLYFSANGGKLPEDMTDNALEVLHTHTPEEDGVVLPIPTHTERPFLGWFTAREGGEQVTGQTQIVSDTTSWVFRLAKVILQNSRQQ